MYFISFEVVQVFHAKQFYSFSAELKLVSISSTKLSLILFPNVAENSKCPVHILILILLETERTKQTDNQKIKSKIKQI